MAQSISKTNNRRSSPKFFKLEKYILESDEYTELTPKAVKLLIDLCSQFNGKNNGDLTTAWKIMRKKGWKSKDTLYSAIAELEKNDWIIRTRQGGLHKPNLFAISWLAIDDCNGKLDIKPTQKASHKWKKYPSTNSVPLKRF